jgi:hypothetical protein
MDDGKVAHQADVDVARFQPGDRDGLRGLAQERGAIDQRAVGVGAEEIIRQDFLEPLHVHGLHRADVVRVEPVQRLQVGFRRSARLLCILHRDILLAQKSMHAGPAFLSPPARADQCRLALRELIGRLLPPLPNDEPRRTGV